MAILIQLSTPLAGTRDRGLAMQDGGTRFKGRAFPMDRVPTSFVHHREPQSAERNLIIYRWPPFNYNG